MQRSFLREESASSIDLDQAFAAFRAARSAGWWKEAMLPLRNARNEGSRRSLVG
jgi:hypothetical protein